MDKYTKLLRFNYFANNIANKLQNSSIETIYHYTSAKAFKEIIKHKKLRFSDVHYLNDKSELKYAYDTLWAIIDGKNDFRKSFIKDLKSYVNIHIYHKPIKLTKLPRQNIFVASFSLAPDELTLWNYYTKTDSKCGYNIGFKLNAFSKNYDKYRFFSGKVIYEKQEQENQIKQALYEYQDYYLEEKDKELRYDRIGTFMDLMEVIALFYKHNAFAAEQEYRMVYFHNENDPKYTIDYEPRDGIFVPYIQVNFIENCVKSVTASPLIDINLCDGVEQFLRNNGIHINKITPSIIPLRY